MGWVWLHVAGCGLGFYYSPLLTLAALCLSLLAKLSMSRWSIVV